MTFEEFFKMEVLNPIYQCTMRYVCSYGYINSIMLLWLLCCYGYTNLSCYYGYTNSIVYVGSLDLQWSLISEYLVANLNVNLQYDILPW